MPPRGGRLGLFNSTTKIQFNRLSKSSNAKHATPIGHIRIIGIGLELEEAHAGISWILFAFEKTPRTSLSGKPVPLQNRVDEFGLFKKEKPWE